LRAGAEEVQKVPKVGGEGGFEGHAVELEGVDELEAEGVEGLAGDEGRERLGL
jgi:hypothetical protein